MPRLLAPRGAGEALERDDQIAVFHSLLDASSPWIVHLPGDPGRGKSHLLRVFAAMARDRGLATVTAPADGVVPRAVADGSPAVVLVDDLHRASDRTHAWLLEQHRSGAVRGMVLAYRPRQVGRALHRSLSADLAPHALLSLPPLSVAGLRELVGDARSAAIHRASAGNPAYARVLAHVGHADVGSVPWLDRAAAESLPLVVAGSLGLELDQLGQDEREVLAVASVLGHQLTSERLSRLRAGPWTRAELDEILGRLLRADLLRVQREGAGVAMRHPVVRLAAYQELPSGSRQALHEAAAGLETGWQRLHHLALSLDGDDLDAIREIVTSSTRQPAPSREWLVTRADLAAVAQRDPGLGREIEIIRARAQIERGDVEAARSLLDGLSTCAHQGGPPDPRLLRLRATVLRLGAVSHRGRDVVVDALSRHTFAPGITAVLEAEAAICAVLAGDPRARAHADRAVGGVGHVEEGTAAAFVLVAQALARSALDRGGDVTGPLDEAARLVDAAADGDLADEPELLSLLAWCELLCERDPDAVRHLDRGRALMGEQHPVLPLVHAGLCHARSRGGLLDEAIGHGRRAVALAAAMGEGPVLSFSQGLLASAVALRDGPGPARELVTHLRLADCDARVEWMSRVTCRVVARLTVDDDSDHARVALLRVCGGAGLASVEWTSRAYWHAQVAELEMRERRFASAAEHARRARSTASESRLAGQQAHAALVSARVALLAGDRAAAGQWAGAAAEGFESLRWVMGELEARLLLAQVCASRGQTSAARAELSIAGSLCARTSSAVAQSALMQVEVALGGALAADASHRQLTRREREVVDLVLSGASNGLIAKQLFITVKAVEAHLTRIFRKHGVANRTALMADVIARGGLVTGR